ncbi:hypothetical protein LXA43DRAFT_195818 [Ganoderma leucocontextum]|nr:hypothetical protein LXA43DRAFT_195818 [Ganoderma leucocontextum]
MGSRLWQSIIPSCTAAGPGRQQAYVKLLEDPWLKASTLPLLSREFTMGTSVAPSSRWGPNFAQIGQRLFTAARAESPHRSREHLSSILTVARFWRRIRGHKQNLGQRVFHRGRPSHAAGSVPLHLRQDLVATTKNASRRPRWGWNRQLVLKSERSARKVEPKRVGSPWDRQRNALYPAPIRFCPGQSDSVHPPPFLSGASANPVSRGGRYTFTCS